MSEKIYPVSAEWAQRAFINEAKYKDMYARSVSDPQGFWGEQGKRIDWMTPYTKVKNKRKGDNTDLLLDLDYDYETFPAFTSFNESVNSRDQYQSCAPATRVRTPVRVQRA